MAARKKNEMNQTEKAWSDELDDARAAGEIKWWAYEACKLYLTSGKLTSYTPDFMVWMPDGTIRFDEVKGYWRDDARVKIKVAADRFPLFKFQAMSMLRKGKGWKIEQF